MRLKTLIMFTATLDNGPDRFTINFWKEILKKFSKIKLFKILTMSLFLKRFGTTLRRFMMASPNLGGLATTPSNCTPRLLKFIPPFLKIKLTFLLRS
jgi:hypothetical protein